MSDLEDHKHHSFKLQNDYDNASDKTIFQFEIIEQISNIRELKKKEQYYINLYHSYENGYNSCPFADNPKYITNASSDPKLLVNKRKYMEGNFVMIPRELIEMKNLPFIRLSVFTYLARKRPLDDCVNMNINQIVEYSGYIPDSHKNKINDKFVIMLDTLEGMGYFSKINGEYKNDKNCVLRLNIERFEAFKSFACVSLKELDIINQFATKKEVFPTTNSC